MALTKLTTDLDNIQALSDTPNSTEGLTSAELKERFDQAGNDIKDYVNNTLTDELDTDLADKIDTTSGDARYLQISNNLSEVTAATARTNLGLGDSSTLDVGTATSTVCAGDDSRLSDSRTCDNTFDSASTSRTNLGLGSIATKDIIIQTTEPTYVEDKIWLKPIS